MIRQQIESHVQIEGVGPHWDYRRMEVKGVYGGAVLMVGGGKGTSGVPDQLWRLNSNGNIEIN